MVPRFPRCGSTDSEAHSCPKFRKMCCYQRQFLCSMRMHAPQIVVLEEIVCMYVLTAIYAVYNALK